MKKEVLLAIIIGFALGLVITFGIWTANKALKQSAPQESEPEPQVSQPVTPSVAPGQLLLISTPEDNSISNQEKINVAGKTNPKTAVTILYGDGEKIIESDEQGNFTAEITLVGGANEIKITVFDDQGAETTKIIKVIYSTAEL